MFIIFVIHIKLTYLEQGALSILMRYTNFVVTTHVCWHTMYDIVRLFYFYLVKKLLIAGACPDSSNEDGLTVLHQVLICV